MSYSYSLYIILNPMTKISISRYGFSESKQTIFEQWGLMKKFKSMKKPEVFYYMTFREVLCGLFW